MQVRNLEEHIKQGCVSDVPGRPLYLKSEGPGDDSLKYTCFRGTNGNEGYHLFLRKILSSYRVSPLLAHCLLMEFNHRWNMRMAIRRRGLTEELLGVYDTTLVEALQDLTATWWPEPIFADWISTRDYLDTGERSGLATTVLDIGTSPAIGPLTGPAATWGGGVELSVADLAASTAGSVAPSALALARLMGTTIPVRQVIGKVECEKFNGEWPRFRGRDDLPDFARWASAWNEDCARVERGEARWGGIFRKSAGYLEDHWKRLQERERRHATLRPHRDLQRRVSQELRSPGEAALFSGSVLTGVAARAVAPPASAAPRLAVPLAVGGGDSAQVRPRPAKKPKTATSCSVCGHLKDAFPAHHIRGARGRPGQCTVSTDQRRDSVAAAGGGRHDVQSIFGGVCTCVACTKHTQAV
jgi:hypothetical protein